MKGSTARSGGQDPPKAGLAVTSRVHWPDVARRVAHTLAHRRRFVAAGRRYWFAGVGDPFGLQEAVDAVMADLRGRFPASPVAALGELEAAVDRFLEHELGRAREALGAFRRVGG